MTKNDRKKRPKLTKNGAIDQKKAQKTTKMSQDKGPKMSQDTGPKTALKPKNGQN